MLPGRWPLKNYACLQINSSELELIYPHVRCHSNVQWCLQKNWMLSARVSATRFSLLFFSLRDVLNGRKMHQMKSLWACQTQSAGCISSAHAGQVLYYCFHWVMAVAVRKKNVSWQSHLFQDFIFLGTSKNMKHRRISTWFKKWTWFKKNSGKK